MSISFGCKGCRQFFTVDDHMRNLSAKCPLCGLWLTVPEQSLFISIPASEDIFFNCQSCGQSLVVATAGEGLTVSCPRCAAKVTVQDGTSPPWIFVPEG